MSFRILVADDSQPMRRLVCRFLEAVGVGRPVETETSEDTLAQLKSGSFDLAIVEIHMSGPGPAGIELIESIRAIQPAIRLVVMTTEADERLVQAALEAGATEYLIKPFEVAERQRLLELCHQVRPKVFSKTE